MTVLVGFTPKPEGYAALDFAIEQARAFDEPLIVINTGIGEQAEEKGVATPSQLEEADRRLRASGVGYELKQFIRGNDPVDELLALAESDPQIRLIAIGGRRRSAVGKRIMGSKAQRIILESAIPVVSVKA
ncbi:universal stress protein [Brevibacterium sp. 5221]|uniref:Universal stress protein n=1 Tax=Brevibacterium rongguiense TaxID=2695267 RepID=A0A6N9H3N6_9MICO|nr:MULTISPECIES: universal stress protein [Brevibacterium]MYM18533.1 universal stress protein [Brevibacterium rongguiense]WAL39605.1 universal stress protein [Brevibacterium sp. BRM-1]